MKKILMLGSAITAMTPIAVVVACSDEQKAQPTKTPEQQTPTKTPEQQTPTKTTEQKPNIGGGVAPEEDNKDVMASGNNPFTNIKEDGLFLWDKTYEGKLWDGGTKQSGSEVKGIARINEQSGWDLDPTVQLGKKSETDDEDSIYMVYDDDDSDGLSMDNFNSTVYFEDTSVAMSDALYSVNEKVFGNKTGKWSMGKAEYVSFRETDSTKVAGQINSYVGSQNNHVDDSDASFMIKIKEFVDTYKLTQPTVVTKLLEYYGLKMDGVKIVEDASIINHASRLFAPVFYTKPIFTYEKVFDNVIKITYHDQPGFQCTAAHFRLKQLDGSYKSIGSWSLGKGDWSSYWGHAEARYVGLKD